MAIRTWESEEYHTFWQQSHFLYLDKVERRLLPRLLNTGEWFIDIGGGYGRLMETYIKRYSKCVITDYSMSMLRDANRYLINNQINNVFLVAADAHHLPFSNSVFDSAMMIRLIHHVNNPGPVLLEAHRILRPSGLFILEYQNKRNINFRIKARLGLMERKDVESCSSLQVGPLYWNFHPKAIEQFLWGFFIQEDILGAGLFWHRKLLTSLLPNLEAIDSWFAPLLGHNYITHQLFLKLRATKQRDEANSDPHTHNHMMTNILKCLCCGHGSLERSESYLACSRCHRQYPIQENIYDFRMNKDE